jgi:hypothetical protein
MYTHKAKKCAKNWKQKVPNMLKNIFENSEWSQAPVAHACNPSYSGVEIAVQSQPREIVP